MPSSEETILSKCQISFVSGYVLIDIIKWMIGNCWAILLPCCSCLIIVSNIYIPSAGNFGYEHTQKKTFQFAGFPFFNWQTRVFNYLHTLFPTRVCRECLFLPLMMCFNCLRFFCFLVNVITLFHWYDSPAFKVNTVLPLQVISKNLII